MELQLIGFKVGKEHYAIDILSVVQIIRMVDEITTIPKAPRFIEGIINLRGDVIPIIDLRKRFGSGGGEDESAARIIITRLKGYRSRLGLIVNSVHQVIRVQEKDLMSAPDILEGGETEYVKQVIKIDDRLFLLMETEKLLSPLEKKKLESTALAGK